MYVHIWRWRKEWGGAREGRYYSIGKGWQVLGPKSSCGSDFLKVSLKVSLLSGGVSSGKVADIRSRT